MRKSLKELKFDSAFNYKTEYELTVDTKNTKPVKAIGYSARMNLRRKMVNTLLVLVALVALLFTVPPIAFFAIASLSGITALFATSTSGHKLLNRIKGKNSETTKPAKTIRYSFKAKVTRGIVLLLLVTAGIGGVISPASANIIDDIDDIGDTVANAPTAVMCPNPAVNSKPAKLGLMKSMTADTVGRDANGNKLDVKLTAFELYADTPRWTEWQGISKGHAPDELKHTDSYKDNNAIYREGSCFLGMSISEETFPNGLANVIFMIVKLIVWAMITLIHYGIVTEDLITVTIAPTFEDTVIILKETIFINFLPVVIMISALVIFFLGVIQRKSTKALHAVLWLLSATIVSDIVISNPLMVVQAPVKVSNVVIANLATDIVEASLGTTNSALANNMCQVNPGDASQRVNMDRQIGCLYWVSFVYIPWVQGQFGSDPAVLTQNLQLATSNSVSGANSPSVNMGGGMVATPHDWSIIHLESMVQRDGENAEVTLNKIKQFNVIADAQVGSPSGGGSGEVNMTWKGNGWSRVGIALVALVGVVGISIPTIMTAFNSILFIFILCLLMLTTPIIGLITPIPKYGTKIAKGWLGFLVESTAFHVFNQFLLFVIILFMTSFMKSTAGNLIAGIIATLAVSFGAIIVRKKALTWFGLDGTAKTFGKLGRNVIMPGIDLKLAGLQVAHQIVKGDYSGAAKSVSNIGKNPEKQVRTNVPTSGKSVKPESFGRDKDVAQSSMASTKSNARNSGGNAGNASTTPMGSNNRVTPEIATDNPSTATKSSTKSNAGNGNTASTATQKAHILKGYDNRVSPSGWGSEASMETGSAQVEKGAVRSPAGATNGATSGQEASQATGTPTSPAKASGSDTRSANRPQETVITREVIAELPTQRSSGATQQSQASSGTSRASQQASSSPEPEPAKAKVSMLPTKSDKPAQNQSVTFQAKLPDNSVASGSQGGLPKRSQSLPKAGGSGTSRPSR